MSNIELLKLAAKGAGMKIRVYEGVNLWPHESYVVVDHRGFKWNPLFDDGDALRLAVECNMMVDVLSDSTDCYAPGVERVNVDHCGDAEKATRRAIVLVAVQRALAR